MKNSSLLISAVILLGIISLSGCGRAESKVYKQYYDVVTGADTKKWDGFALIDLDGDGVSELFATCINGEREDESIQPYMIVGYKDNAAVLNEELQDGVAGAGGYRGTLYYIGGKGLLHESMTIAPFGLPADTVYKLRDGTVEISDTGEFSIDSYGDPEDEDWDPLQNGTWTWNGETVTEEQYNDMLNKALSGEEGLPMSSIEWKSRDDILKELK